MATIANLETAQKEIEQSLSQKLADFEKRLTTVSTHNNPNLTQLSEEFYSFKSLVTTMLSLLRQQIYECSKTVDQIDMRQRQKVLLFNGIDEKTESDVENDVLHVMHSKMGLSHITSGDFKRCHRLGVTSEDRVRPILVHFHEHKLKSEVWKSKAKLKGSPITVTEFLTRPRQAVYKSARAKFGMRNVWTIDGVIYIKTDGGRNKVVTEFELNSLIAKASPVKTPTVQGSPPRREEDCKEGKDTASSNSQQDTRRCKQPVATTSSDDSKRSRRIGVKK